MSEKGYSLVSRRAEAGLLLLAAFVLGFPLLFGSALAGHDTRTYLMYASQIAANLRDGILLPAWAPDLNGGYGGPGLLFYPPLVHYLHAVPCLLGLSALLSIGFLAVAGSFLTGFAMRGWLRADGRPGALAASLVYMAAPYRLIDVYERTALSEHWAFVFPPLILWAMTSARPATGRRAALVALGTSGLLLTNFPLAALFGPVLAVYALLSERCAGRRAEIGAGAALGIGLSLFALVPAALASRWVATEVFYGGLARGLAPSQNTLFGSPPLNPDFHFRVSVSAVVTLLLVLAAFFLQPRVRQNVFWLGVGAGSFLLMTTPFGGLWDALPLLSRLQFPWRLSAVATFALAALVAGLSRAPARLALVALTALAAFLVPERPTASLADVPLVPPFVAARGRAFPDPEAVFEAGGFAASPWLLNLKLADVWYLPRTLGEPLAREVYADGPTAEPALRDRFVAAVRGQPLKVKLLEQRRVTWTLRVTAADATPVVFHQLWFPGMSVEVDGQRVAAGVERRTGLLVAGVPAGEHVVTWRWRPFPPLGAARLASLACLIVLLIAARWSSFRRGLEAAPRS